MRVLYIDIDSLRPDHLGCYGYHRDTSPNIDRLAAEGIRFDNVYVSDAPCLPSRTALWSGRCGFRTGVINHGGQRAQPYNAGSDRGSRDEFGRTSWMTALRKEGLRTVTISSFADRHTAWHWYAGYDEVIVTAGHGLEIADAVTPRALDWLEGNAPFDDWFLHVNYWDPHTPYRTPDAFGNPFVDDPLPDWLTEETRQRMWDGFGPHSPQEPMGFDEARWITERWPGQPLQLDSMAAVRQQIDGYDTGIRYADHHVGLLLKALEEAGVLDETVIVISADHGENQGELNVWGDHQTADHITCRVPLIVRWPGGEGGGRVDGALHYHFDFAATLIELAGGLVPEGWDGVSFAGAFQNGAESGRDYLVISQGAWACQRGVRFNYDDMPYLMIRSYHDGYKMCDPYMLFNLADDPHEQHNLAYTQPDLLGKAVQLLDAWMGEMMRRSPVDVDPFMTVMREGGPFYTRGMLPAYLKRLEKTGREHHAKRLAQIHPVEALG